VVTAKSRAYHGRRKRERTRERLLDAAIGLFARQAVEATRIEDLVRTADISRGTFYNYFRTIDQVQVACLARIFTLVAAEAAPAAGAVHRPAMRIAVEILGFLMVLRRHRTWARAYVHLRPSSLPLTRYRQVQVFRARLRQGVSDGVFRVASTESAFDMVAGTLMVAVRSMLGGRPQADHARAVTVTVLQGLGVGYVRAQTICREAARLVSRHRVRTPRRLAGARRAR